MGAVIALVVYGLAVWAAVYLGMRKDRLVLGWVLGILLSWPGVLVMALIPKKKRQPTPIASDYYQPVPGYFPPNYQPHPSYQAPEPYPMQPTYNPPPAPRPSGADAPTQQWARSAETEPDWTDLQPRK